MPSSQTAVVVTHCVEIVQWFLTASNGETSLILWRDYVLFYFWVFLVVTDRQRIDHELRQVKSAREVNFGLVFLLADQSLLFESLKMEDQDLGGSVDAHLLVG